MKAKVLYLHGSNYCFNIHLAKEIFCKTINAEIELVVRVRLNKKIYYIRLSSTKSGYFKGMKEQVAAGVYKSPRYKLASIHKRLRALQRSVGSCSDSDPDKIESDSSSKSENDETPNEEKYVVLSRLGVSLDLSLKHNKVFIQDLIGECFALQLIFNTENKTLNKYQLP